MLEKIGLVEKIIATPMLYKAIPLSEGSLSLFQRKSDEHTKLKSSLKMLFDNKEKSSNAVVQDSNSEFVITSERKRFLTRLEKSFSEASSCDMIFPKTALNFVTFNFYECLSSAISRGSKIRVITKKTDMLPVTARKLRNLATNPNFEIKFVDSPSDIGIIILDNTEVNISISEREEVPSLWTNNSQVLKMTQRIFENEWNSNQNGIELTYKRAL
jgi:sugar-specific transcriptional regulator TrmB